MGQIVIGFCAFKSLAGDIVQFGTQGSVGHAFIVLPDGKTVIDAQHQDGLGGQPGGVWRRPMSYLAESGGYNICTATLPTTDECAESFYQFALSQEGDPYDIKADYGIAMNQDWHTDGKLICSGFVMCCLTMPKPSFLGYPLVKNPHIWSPEEVLVMCNAFAPIVMAQT